MYYVSLNRLQLFALLVGAVAAEMKVAGMNASAKIVSLAYQRADVLEHVIRLHTCVVWP